MATKIMTQEAGQVLAGKIKVNTAAIAANQSSITTIQAAVDALNGSGAGSVDKKVEDKIAEVVANAPADLDTLKEIADWIDGHGDDAAAMNSAIKANQSSITTMQAAIDALEAGTVTVDSVISDTSENPLQNKVIVGAVQAINAQITALTTADAEAQSSITTIQAAVQNLEDNALTVDTVLSTTSENPVQNKVIKAALDEIVASGVTVDTALSDTSENPVQNKAVKAAIDAVEAKVDAVPEYETVSATEAEAWFN